MLTDNKSQIAPLLRNRGLRHKVIRRREAPAIGLPHEGVVSGVVVGVAHASVEHHPTKELTQITLRAR